MKIAWMLPEPIRGILQASGIKEDSLREIRFRTGGTVT